MATERTPLLEDHAHNFWSFSVEDGDSYHLQFCKLIGIPPTDLGPHEHIPPIPPKSLYGRALALKKSQIVTYSLTATLSNTLLLSQVILGAALTALGASESSHVLITLFGATNTIIAGVVAYLKSRGQPMRARMYKDDLERVVNEIENSEVMWRGISRGILGYDEINIDHEVTVRSEIARLTRLFDQAVRTNTLNNPDMYSGDSTNTFNNVGLRAKPLQPAPPAPPTEPASAPPPPAAAAVAAPDPDQSPATAVPTPPKVEAHEADHGGTMSMVTTVADLKGQDSSSATAVDVDKKGKEPATS